MKITIEDDGCILNIPGKGEVRTPCELYIRDSELLAVIGYIKSRGIENFKIDSGTTYKKSILPNNTKMITARKDSNIVIHKVETKIHKQDDTKIDQLHDKIDKLQKIIENSNLSPIYITEPKTISAGYENNYNKNDSRGYKNSFTKRKDNAIIEELNDSFDEYIPDISFDGLTSNNLGDSKIVVDDDDDLNDTLEGLRKVKK